MTRTDRFPQSILDPQQLGRNIYGHIISILDSIERDNDHSGKPDGRVGRKAVNLHADMVGPTYSLEVTHFRASQCDGYSQILK